MLRKLAFLSCALLLNAVNASGAESDSATQNCGTANMTFEGWRQWTSVTPVPVRSKGHSNNWVGIYVNKLAKATYLSASSPYAVCSKIVKPIYTDSSGEKIRKLTIMVKMSPGFDPENADWWYGVYDESGKDMWDEGKLSGCIICHKQAADTDYLFSNDVISAGTE